MQQENRKKFIVNFLFYGIWILIAVALLRYALPALTPFALAVVISWVVKRPIEWLMRITKLPRRWVAILVDLIFFSTIGLLIVLLCIRVLAEGVAIFTNIPKLYDAYVKPVVENAMSLIEESVIVLDPSLMATIKDLLTSFVQSIGDILSGLSMSFVSAVSSITSSLPGLFIELVLLIISTFFITIDYEKLTGFFYRQMDHKVKSTFLVIKEYIFGTLLVCIRSYALIMSITCVELSIGLSILGLENAVLIAVLISLFDILPVLGTGGIMIPWMVIAALQGDASLALGLLVVYIVITVIRNIIEPKIVGKQIGLHPILTLSSMFLGVQMFGVIGLFGFPIGLSLLGHLNEKGIIKVFKTE